MPVPADIGRYVVERVLGSGAFAVVWLGHDRELDDRVAIKVLSENWAHQLDIRDRFVQEARVLRQARSERVVQVFDIGELPDGRPYFVMSYADRGSLADRADRMGAATALRHGADIALGVADLHRVGIMHRDIKPSNVLFRSDGGGVDRLVIADLGLSKRLAEASGFTLAAGTPGFMAPEQADGLGLDHRVDVYGVGATVYHLLTGAKPVIGRAVAPSALRAGLPARTDEVLLRALATDPADRWPTAIDLAKQLATLAAARPARHAPQKGPAPATADHGPSPSVLRPAAPPSAPSDESGAGAGSPLRATPLPGALPESAPGAAPGTSSGPPPSAASGAPPSPPINPPSSGAPAGAGAPLAVASPSPLLGPPPSAAPPGAAAPLAGAPRGAPVPAPVADAEVTTRIPAVPGSPSRRRRTRVRWLAGAAVLLIAGAAALVVFRPWQQGTAPDRVKVVDDQGRIQLTVPAGWAGERQGGGWRPSEIGARGDEHSPGVAVAADLFRWRDHQDRTPGVFVGLSDDAEVAGLALALRHDGCRAGKPVERSGVLTGQVIRWTCPNDVTFDEAGLRTEDGASVYVQIKQSTHDPDRADEILTGLRAR